MVLVQVLCLSLTILCALKSVGSAEQGSSCGSIIRNTGTIVFGSSFKRGDYPWMVALLYTRVNPPTYFCGGTLVSTKHVITAAHCMKPKYGQQFDELHPIDILAWFGAYNLTNLFEPERLSISPEKIHVHEEWNNQVERYDADIAILQFAPNSIKFSRFVQPVCLSLSSPSVLRETKAIVAGWGQNEDQSRKYQPVPKSLEVPIHTNEKCFLRTSGLAEISSPRTFCAGLENGSGVCLGDSGNGLFVVLAGVAHLRGIVSSSRTIGTTCDVSAYAVYTDVSKYKDWIDKIIVEGRSEVAKTTMTTITGNNSSNQLPSLIVNPTGAPRSEFECGVPEFKPTSRSKRIISPTGSVIRGQMPWLAAIYSSDPEKQGFLCSGTLVSLKVVVTAAHCLHEKHTRKARADALTVFVGKTNLEGVKELGSLRSSVTTIEAHSDWNASNNNLDADIGIVVLHDTIMPSRFIKPICLWMATNSIDDLVGKTGVIAGWGRTTKESQAFSFEQPNWTQVTVLTQDRCLQSQSNYFEVASRRIFCAFDERGESGPCQGDYGDGLFVQNNGKWYLRGIVSGDFNANDNCDTRKFVLYTDVSQFSNWLNDNIQKHT